MNVITENSILQIKLKIVNKYKTLENLKKKLHNKELLDEVFLPLDVVVKKEDNYDDDDSAVANLLLIECVNEGLILDLLSVLQYREKSMINCTKDNFVKIFGIKFECFFDLLDFDCDFIYTSVGVKILCERYLQNNEPIQFFLFKIALNLSRYDDKKFKKLTDYEKNEIFIFYKLLSLNILQVSSLLANLNFNLKQNNYDDDDDDDDGNGDFNGSEACKLYVCKEKYDYVFLKQLSSICHVVKMGVGIGMNVTSVPLNGNSNINCIKNGFEHFVEHMEVSNKLNLHARKSKIAMYFYIFEDKIFKCFDLKKPNNVKILENVYFGLMIKDLFMNFVKNKKKWYLFNAEYSLKLSNVVDVLEFENLYMQFVESGNYTVEIDACKLMGMIIKSLQISGNPYIIWIDKVNKYNNQKALGPIKTLNLCSEITNWADQNNFANCTLISVNAVMLFQYRNMFDVNFMKKFIESRFSTNIFFYNDDVAAMDFYYEKFLPIYCINFLACIALNNVLTKINNNNKNNSRREIGINPSGLFDASVILNENFLKFCNFYSEFAYKGAIHASCEYFKKYNTRCVNFEKSEFKLGNPQWYLRGKEEKLLLSDWKQLRFLMTKGMANSMLTSQAPTATTSLLGLNCESICLPMDLMFNRESLNGRVNCICLGYVYKIINNQISKVVNLNKILKDKLIEIQLNAYADSSFFIDHSQSTMFTIDLKNSQEIFNLILQTWLKELKTGIYYIIPKKQNEILNIIKFSQHHQQENYYQQQQQEYNQNTCDACSL